MLKLLKGLEVDSKAVKTMIPTILPIVDEFLYYSREHDLMDVVDVDLIEVYLIVSEHCRNHPDHRTNSRSPSYQGKDSGEFGQCAFIALAIEYNLGSYITTSLMRISQRFRKISVVHFSTMLCGRRARCILYSPTQSRDRIQPCART